MAERTPGRMGAPRAYALLFGIILVGVGILELYFPRGDPLTAGRLVILQRAVLNNLLHFVVGIVLVGAFFAGQGPARTAARIVGAVVGAVAIWGFVSPATLGSVLGYDGDVPVIYNIFHAATAVLALVAGFTPAGREEGP